MQQRLFRRRYLVALALFLNSIPLCSIAQSSSLRSQPAATSYSIGIQALNRGDYREALAEIQDAIQQDTDNLDYQYVLGIVYSRMQRFEEAQAIFGALLQQNEQLFRKVYFDLAFIYVQTGKEEMALETIEKARPVDPGRADYEKGIVYMRLKRFPQAVGSFQRAVASKPELATEAMTQEAIAQYHLKNFGEAKNLLEKVLGKKLPPNKAEEIRRMLDAVQSALKASRPWQLSAAVGFQYDDNVYQTPFQQANFQAARLRHPGEKDDGGFLASVTGRYRLLEKDAWQFGVGYNHYSMVYVDHSELDVVGMRPSVYAQWQGDAMRADMQYIYSHFWVDGKSWVNVHSFLPRFIMAHGDRWRTEILGGTEWHLYDDATPDDRLYFIGATEFFLMRGGKAHLRLGFLGGYEDLVPDARADYRIYEPTLGLQWPIWEDRWFVDISGRYIWRDYDFDPTISNTTSRLDQEKNLSFTIYGQITPSVQLAFLFQQIWSDSNIPDPPHTDFYNYTRAVYTWMVTYNF
jgi:tetratricopeptide (TPR) repeat protein